MKLRNLLAVSATAFTLLSCNDSDNHPTPGKGELTPITVNIKGNADTRALTGEETGATNENDINSLEFFVFNSDGSFQKYYKPASVASDNQYTFLVNAGSLTILTAANQNLATGPPSKDSHTVNPHPPLPLWQISKRAAHTKSFLWMAQTPVRTSVLPSGLPWRQKGRPM